jgi:hypothetical protein
MRFEEADGDLQVAFAGLPPSARSGLDSGEEG